MNTKQMNKAQAAGAQVVQHTPGPWTWDPYWNLIHGQSGVEVAAIHAAMQRGEKRARLDTAHANARLIAAAPELLRALKAIVQHGNIDCGTYWKVDKDDITRAINAIQNAEAEGKL